MAASIAVAGGLRRDTRFDELVRKRRRLSLGLTAAILIVYFGFIFLVAFDPALMAQPVSGVITLGLFIGVGVILFSILITGVYVWRANTTYDRLTREIVGGAR